MTATSERFTADGVDRLEIDGQLVHAAVTFDIPVATTVSVVLSSAHTDRAQGLVFDSSRTLSAAEVTAKRLVVWADTAPNPVEIHLPEGRLTIWNVWRDEGIEQAWIGWAAIRRTSDGAVEQLLCSDGHEPGDVDDLTAELTFEPPLEN